MQGERLHRAFWLCCWRWLEFGEKPCIFKQHLSCSARCGYAPLTIRVRGDLKKLFGEFIAHLPFLSESSGHPSRLTGRAKRADVAVRFPTLVREQKSTSRQWTPLARGNFGRTAWRNGERNIERSRLEGDGEEDEQESHLKSLPARRREHSTGVTRRAGAGAGCHSAQRASRGPPRGSRCRPRPATGGGGGRRRWPPAGGVPGRPAGGPRQRGWRRHQPPRTRRRRGARP